MTLQKRQNYRDSKKVGGCQESRGREKKTNEQVKLYCMILSWWIPYCKLPKLIAGTAQRMNPNVNYGL